MHRRNSTRMVKKKPIPKRRSSLFVALICASTTNSSENRLFCCVVVPKEATLFQAWQRPLDIWTKTTRYTRTINAQSTSAE